MIGRTNVGGTSKAFAVINVTYPRGSTCTCTEGTKTLKLKDTSGQGFFLIPYAATWIVTATDGTNTKSESVEITSEGQSVSVELSYWDGTLYDSGNEYDNITGGWNVFGVATKEATYLKTICNPNSEACAYTAKKIDLRKYKNLNFTISGIKSDWLLWVTPDKPTAVADSYSNALAKIQPMSNVTGTLDISSVSSEVYIACGNYSESSNSYGANVAKVWMN